MTVKVIEGIRHDIARKPTRTVSGWKVSMTRHFTLKICGYDLTTSFNMRPVSRAATVIASF